MGRAETKQQSLKPVSKGIRLDAALAEIVNELELNLGTPFSRIAQAALLSFCLDMGDEYQLAWIRKASLVTKGKLSIEDIKKQLRQYTHDGHREPTEN